jgi:phage shock protein A
MSTGYLFARLAGCERMLRQLVQRVLALEAKVTSLQQQLQQLRNNAG